MRITAAMQYERFLGSLRSIRERLADDQSRLASGRRIERPSDDPAGAAEAIALRSRVATLDRYSANASSARSFLAVTESALASMSDLLTQARSAATRAASDANSDVRTEIAREIDSIRDQILTLARTRYQERYVFSGTATTTDPYTAAGVYQGNDGEIRVEVGDSETVSLNLRGTDALGTGGGTLALLEQLSASLRADDTAAIRAALPAIEAARKSVSDARSQVGLRLARIDEVVRRHGDLKVSLLTRLDEVEGADTAETITRFARDKTAEEAALAAGSRIASRSLFDYLR